MKPNPAPILIEISEGERVIGFVHQNRVTGNWHAFDKDRKWIEAFRSQDEAEKAVRESR